MTVCIDCQKMTGLSALYAATEYKAGAQSAVHALKYGHSRATARYMADALIEAHPTVFLRGNLCYLPTVNARVRQRGYDQAALITKELMRRTTLPSLPLLARYKDTRQVGASKTQRHHNMTQAFYIRAANVPQNKPIILIDDVITTGASMRAAATLLRQYTTAPIIAVSYALKP